MEYKNIDGVKMPVSRLVFGTASDPFIEGKDQSELLDAALEAGINIIDTARKYGDSEKSIGKWLQSRNTRDKVVILSKCAHHNMLGIKRVNEKAIRNDFELSSKDLGTDFIDIYLLHRDDPEVDAGVPVEIFNAMHAEGKIGIFGASNWTHERIEEANEYAYKHNLIPFTISSPHFSLARQVADPWGGGCVSITGDENKDARLWYQKNQMPVFAYSSLGRGLLTGKLKSEDALHASQVLDKFALKGYGCVDNYIRLKKCEELADKKGCTVSQIAMAWLYHQPENTFAIATMSSPKRIQENVDALSIDLSDEECEYLLDAED
ncbi:MAG: aldo/keto reductase [Pseudobutyrivibrio sp.]|nr:aldo/keto reductase [Pseudobutyrivibrio sp.]